MSTLKYLFPFLHQRNAVFPTNVLVKMDVCRHFYCNKINTAINSDTDSVTDADKGQSRQNVRRLALKLLYIGDRYNGMQQQIDLQNTIEEHLFGALVKARLIQDSVSSNFKKSSRTDKGVSAISQVVAFDVQDDYYKLPNVKCEDNKSKDMIDCRDLKRFNGVIRRINRFLLPDGIKVLGWSFVPEDFNPRKLNQGKMYKYWFRKEGLDLKVMTEACKKFEGTHDFRNLSTMQLKNSYTCTIKSAAITPCEEDPRVCLLTLSGDRFLTHQIRNMMGILYLIGSGREDSTVIDELLDIKTNPGKPQYNKAEALPLCLIKTELASEVKWIYDHSLLHPIYKAVQKKYIDSMLLSSMAKEILDELKTTELDTDDGSITLEEMMKTQTKPVKRASIMSSKRGYPEEFLNLLLNEITKADPFLRISSGDNTETQQTYFYQLIMEKDERLVLPTTQQLFELSFLQMGIKLREIPSCLIIQMPRFGKDYKMYKRILPSLELDITDVLENAPRECIICGDLAAFECKECYQVHGAGLNTIAFCEGCKRTSHQHKQRLNHKPRQIHAPELFKEHYNKLKSLNGQSIAIPREKMELFAVICIQTSHYVSFVKCGSGKSRRWIFFDSMADRMGEQSGYNIPEIKECGEILSWLSDQHYNEIINSPDDKFLPEQMRRLICDAYICMYQSPEVMKFK